jgi:uncharacterized protein YbcI
MEGNSSDAVESERKGAIAAAISTGAVKLLREYTGRGPTKTRTYINSDYIAIVMVDILTKGERSLIADGRSELVLTTRKAYQDTMKPALIGLVEDHTGRKVAAFLSDNHLDPDIAVEGFVLEPENDDDRPHKIEHLTVADGAA